MCKFLFFVECFQKAAAIELSKHINKVKGLRIPLNFVCTLDKIKHWLQWFVKHVFGLVPFVELKSCPWFSAPQEERKDYRLNQSRATIKINNHSDI